MLRQILIPVIYNPEFILQPKLDESVLRAAHRALLRHLDGSKDSFLFILCGEEPRGQASKLREEPRGQASKLLSFTCNDSF